MAVDGTATWSSAQITALTNGALNLTGGNLTLAGLTNGDGSSFQVSGWATVSLPGLTSYGMSNGQTTLGATGSGSALSLPNLSALGGATAQFSLIQFAALAGGTTNLPGLAQINSSPVILKADGAGSVLAVPNLTTFAAQNTGFTAAPGLKSLPARSRAQESMAW